MLSFEDIKILDFAWHAAGPLTTKFLTDHGATAVKVESMTRPSNTRSSAPFKDGIRGINRGGWFAYHGANKLSMSLNLKHPRGLEVAKRLVKWADIVAENFTPGTMERLGLGYDELKAIKPDIIMVRNCIYGQTGPHRHHPGFGILATSLSGFTELAGWSDRLPSTPIAAYGDHVQPRFAAAALLAALVYRRRTGKGQCIDTSQYETGIYFLIPALLDYVVNGRQATRQGNLASNACPHGAYRCKGDDRWCVICVFSDEEWNSFCKVLGDPSWTKQARFATLLDRKQHEDELDRLTQEWTIGLTPEEVMYRMQAGGVPAGVVNRASDLLDDPQLKVRSYFSMLNHSEIGLFPYESQPFILSKTPKRARLPHPCLGEHTEYVCTQLLGMNTEEFLDLLESGALE